MHTHSAASDSPMMPIDQFAELLADIAANGQQKPIVLYEGKILDGRARYEACRRLGLKPVTVSLNEGDIEVGPAAYLNSANHVRRHVSGLDGPRSGCCEHMSRAFEATLRVELALGVLGEADRAKPHVRALEQLIRGRSPHC
ncbi:ParB N-terminal domain-containing protein [Lacipirellula sp.]|uniref:ParB N-terminal domain-containing protein n=1 Tax=Lacipirellula sp. TaxID=2691419 RepID=UPI003D119D63